MVLKLHSTEPQTHRIDNVAILRPCLPFSPYVDVLSPLPLLYVYYRVYICRKEEIHLDFPFLHVQVTKKKFTTSQMPFGVDHFFTVCL